MGAREQLLALTNMAPNIRLDEHQLFNQRVFQLADAAFAEAQQLADPGERATAMANILAIVRNAAPGPGPHRSRMDASSDIPSRVRRAQIEAWRRNQEAMQS